MGKNLDPKQGLKITYIGQTFFFRKNGKIPSGLTVGDVRKAQQLYLSAFHPDTGDLQNVIGRMSFQVPGGMVLIGAMITWYR